MIISHKYKFIFIKTMKTAGTSIEIFLPEICGQYDILTPIIPHVEPHKARNHEGFYNHISAIDIRSRVKPEIWDTYFKFCVERNPWDKVLSHFYMKKARNSITLSFDEYLSGRDLPIDHPKYVDIEDGIKILVDTIVYYEDLDKQLGEVFRFLGIPFKGALDINAKSEYRTDRRPYHEIYTAKQANIVRQYFANEIALHGYKY